MVVLTERGYLDRDHLEDPYLGGEIEDVTRSQLVRVISKASASNSQVSRTIVATDTAREQAERRMAYEESAFQQVSREIDISSSVHQETIRNLFQQVFSNLETGRGITLTEEENEEVLRTIATEMQWEEEVLRSIAAGIAAGGQVNRTVDRPTSANEEAARSVSMSDQERQEVSRGLSAPSSVGQQVSRQIGMNTQYNAQVSRQIAAIDRVMEQLHRLIDDFASFHQAEISRTNLYPELIPEYLTKPYLSTEYLGEGISDRSRTEVERRVEAPGKGLMEVTRAISEIPQTHEQVDRIITSAHALRSQTNRLNVTTDREHQESQRFIHLTNSQQSQVNRVIHSQKNSSQQVTRRIFKIAVAHAQVSRVMKTAKALHEQVNRLIKIQKNVHGQVERLTVKKLHSQIVRVLYNIIRPRILTEFASRGISGTNWWSNTTAPGDFSIFNVNNDLEEFYWRGEDGRKTGIHLNCDSEIPQGIFVDTLFIGGHNLTTSAIVKFEATNAADPGTHEFQSVALSINLIVEENRIYWVAPVLPLVSYKYWRLLIDDPTNPADFIKIGVIAFGSAKIMMENSPHSDITIKPVEYKNAMKTEGFSSTAVSRSVKNKFSVSFPDIVFDTGDWELLEEVINYARTTLKCVWMFDPSTPAYRSRFSAFGKLSEIPASKHKVRDKNGADYIDFDLEIDEAE